MVKSQSLCDGPSNFLFLLLRKNLELIKGSSLTIPFLLVVFKKSLRIPTVVSIKHLLRFKPNYLTQWIKQLWISIFLFFWYSELKATAFRMVCWVGCPTWKVSKFSGRRKLGNAKGGGKRKFFLSLHWSEWSVGNFLTIFPFFNMHHFYSQHRLRK